MIGNQTVDASSLSQVRTSTELGFEEFSRGWEARDDRIALDQIEETCICER